MNIHVLPDPVLRLIFSKLPLSDLILIYEVCERWSHLLKSIANKRHSLTLLVGESPLNLIVTSKFNIPYAHELVDSVAKIPESGWSHLEYDWLTQSSVCELTRIFSNITNLEIAINDVAILTYKGAKSNRNCISIIDQLIYLLTFYRCNLKNLKIFGFFRGQNQNRVESELRRLIDPINQLSALRSLTLVIQNKFFYNDQLVPLDVSILGQLEEFYFDSMDPLEIITGSLGRYAESNIELKSIGLGNLFAHDTWMEFFQNCSVNLLEKISQFPDAQFANPFHFQRFCQKFCSITSVAVCLYDLPSLRDIFHCLGTSLRQLVHLRILIYLPEPFVVQQEEAFPEVRSVKILTLNASMKSHNQLYSLKLEKMFPDIRVLHYIDHSRECLDCFPNDEVLDNMGQISDRQRDCLRMKLRPWKACQKLSAVYVEGLFGHNGTLKMAVDEI